MPYKPKKPCNQAGCPNLTDTRFCQPHVEMRKREKGIHEKKREYKKDERPSAHQRGYGVTWRRVRKMILAREPLCRFCSLAGRVNAANEVDHIDGNSRNNHESNLRSLCKPCHSSRTRRQTIEKHSKTLSPS